MKQGTKYKIKEEDLERAAQLISKVLKTHPDAAFVKLAYDASRDVTAELYHFQDVTIQHYRFNLDYQLEIFGKEDARKNAISELSKKCELEFIGTRENDRTKSI